MNIPKGQSNKGDNAEKLITYGTKDEREHNDVAQGVALPNVTLINPFYIGSYEGYFYVCLGCHNLHLHYKHNTRLSSIFMCFSFFLCVANLENKSSEV
jgi:hypothetical protein